MGTLQGNCIDPRVSRLGSVIQVCTTGAGRGARRQDDAAAHLGRNTSIRALFRLAVQVWRRLAVRWGSMWLSGVSLSRGRTRSRLAAVPRYGSSSTPTWWPAGSWNWPGGFSGWGNQFCSGAQGNRQCRTLGGASSQNWKQWILLTITYPPHLQGAVWGPRLLGACGHLGWS